MFRYTLRFSNAGRELVGIKEKLQEKALLGKRVMDLAKHPNAIFLWVVFLPIILGSIAAPLLTLCRNLFFYFLLIFPVIILVKILHKQAESNENILKTYLRYIHFVPGGYAYGSSIAKLKPPFVTVAIICINAIVFWQISPETKRMYLFYPYGDPNLLQVVIAFFSSSFLHGSLSHLLGNMFFLWAFGSVVEGRLGHSRYIIFYVVFMLSSKMLNMFVLFLTSLGRSESFMELFHQYHCLGASGAVFGVMGIYAIRCYFSKVKVAVPFILLPFISLSLQVQGILLVIVFFAWNVDDGLHNLGSTHVAHWSHIGGYLGGVAVAWFLGLHKDAACEARECKAENVSRKYLGRVDASARYLEILEDDPCNIKGLEYMFSVNKYNEEQLNYYYVRLLECLAEEDFLRAKALFKEHYPKHVREISPRLLVKLGSSFLKDFELDKAKVCLEFAVAAPGRWQPKGLMLLAETYFTLDNIALAGKVWNMVVRTFPRTPFAEEAQRKLALYGVLS